jgi:hypothetical protein
VTIFLEGCKVCVLLSLVRNVLELNGRQYYLRSLVMSYEECTGVKQQTVLFA